LSIRFPTKGLCKIGVPEKRRGKVRMIRVLVADDHEVVRRGLRQILSRTDDLAVTGEAGTRHELFEKVSQNGHDLVVLDISMPGRNGLCTLKEVKDRQPDLPVLMVGKDSEDQYAVRALKAGASGWLSKESQPEEFISAIRKVSQGKRYISYSLAEKLSLCIGPSSKKSLHEALSDQEYQVLCMLASGKTVKEIANELCLSAKTISTYRFRTLQKMKMSNNAELTSYAIKNRLVE
jgi:two-component system invasion response regulator UvrY